jgi:hypothetical protein
LVECCFTHERYSRAVLGARVSQAGLATKQLYISFAPKPQTRLVLFSKGKGRQRKLFQNKRREAPKITWFQRQKTPHRHARYSDASESFMRLARMAAIFLALAWRSAHQ